MKIDIVYKPIGGTAYIALNEKTLFFSIAERAFSIGWAILIGS